MTPRPHRGPLRFPRAAVLLLLGVLRRARAERLGELRTGCSSSNDSLRSLYVATPTRLPALLADVSSIDSPWRRPTREGRQAAREGIANGRRPPGGASRAGEERNALSDARFGDS